MADDRPSVTSFSFDGTDAVTEAELLRSIFQHAPGFICTLAGQDHILQFVNDAHLRLFGSHDWIGKPVQEAFPGIANQGFYELLDQVYATGEQHVAYNAPARFRRSSHEPEQTLFMDFIYAPIVENGRVTGIFCQGFDVTDRHVAEDALQHSEEQLRLATDAAEVGLWDVDITTDTLFWPARVKAMFGISSDVPVSMVDFYAGLHPEDHEHTSNAFADAADAGKRTLYDVEYRTIGKKDGKVRWVAAKGRGVFDQEGRCVRMIGTAIDVTARKETEEQLRVLNETLEQRVAEALAERQLLANIVETTNALIQVLDLDYRFLAINRASADELNRIYGVLPKIGDSVIELFAHRPEDGSTIFDMWRRALAGEEFTLAEPFGDPAIDRRYYEMRFSSLRNAHGERVGAYMFANDITDRLRDEQRLAEAEEHLRQAQKIEAIGQLTGGVAHDFNNLLMVISGGLNLFEHAGAEKRERLMDGMRNAVERGAALTRQLLAFSRRKPLTPETVELPRQIDGMSELLDRTLRGDVHVETRFEEDLWPVRIDPAELELVLLNLCVNARDAMPDGGTITITAENTNEVGTDLAGEYVRLSVIDTGVGMPPEVQAKVFEPFFTTKDVGKGSGLGMAQVYGFAVQSDGGVRVRSAIRKGTTVELLLPRSRELPIQQNRQLIDFGTGDLSGRQSGSILLVEDDHEVAALVTEMLGDLGYRVTRAASPDGALGALANGRPVDVVFSDIMMPGGMNGVELAREIRRRRPGLPILLTSGYAGAAAREAASENIPILAKPYQIDALDQALRRIRAG